MNVQAFTIRCRSFGQTSLYCLSAFKPRPARPRITMRSHSTVAKNNNQRFTLPDGRIMGYSEVGLENGYPVLYFHGFPSSRLEGIAFDTLARKRGLRFFTLERPGFGISTPQPKRRLMDWPKDVKAFAEHLGLRRFAIMGGSGGGPYALACAQELPREMLSAVGLLASGGPYDKGLQHIPTRSRLGRWAAYWWPSGFSALSGGVVGTAKWALQTGPGTRWFEDIIKKQNESSGQKSSRTVKEQREDATRIIFEGFAQGPQAFVQEAAILSQDWGFKLEKLEYDPIHMWHGTEDTNAPIGWIRAMAKRIPHSKLTEFEGDTHYTLTKRLERILRELVPDSVESKPMASGAVKQSQDKPRPSTSGVRPSLDKPRPGTSGGVRKSHDKARPGTSGGARKSQDKARH